MKPDSNAVFVEKDKEEKRPVFLESIIKRATVLKQNSAVNSNNLKDLQTSMRRNNLSIICSLTSLENLKVRASLLEKTNTKHMPPTITATNLCKSTVDATTTIPVISYQRLVQLK